MSVICPETRQKVGKGTGIDIYKHTIQTFHLPDRGIDATLNALQDESPERRERIAFLLEAAKAEK